MLDRRKVADHLRAMAQKIDPAFDPTRCHAARDGECIWALCPQERDCEPHSTGRHCPLDYSTEEF